MNVSSQMTRPSAKELGTLSLDAPQKYLIKDDFPLFVFNDPSQKVVSLSFVTHKAKGDSLLENLAPYLIASTLTQGTKKRSGLEIAEKIDQYGALLEVISGRDSIELSLTVLAKYLLPLLPLIIEILTAPLFQDESLALGKEIIRKELLLSEVTPRNIVEKKLRQRVFGTTHPYGYTVAEKELKTITSSVLHDYFSSYLWQLSHCTLSGSVSEKMIDAVRSHLASLSSVRIEKRCYTPFLMKKPLYIKKKDASQASIAIGTAAIKQGEEDYPALYLLHMLLGGYFGSRLMQRIREEKGYTYGVQSRLTPYLDASYFYITTEVKKDFGQETCEYIYKEIEDIQRNMVQEKEMKSLKQYVNGHFLNALDNVFSIAKLFDQLHLSGLDLSYYVELYMQIQRVDGDELSGAAQKYLPLGRLSQVVVTA